MRFFDAHVHTTFSRDGKTPPAGYFPLPGEVGGVGFCEHLDFLPCCGSYGFLDLPAYFAAVSALRDKGLPVFCGVEVDYHRSVEPDIRQALRDNAFDYTIGSVHMIGGFSVSGGALFPGGEPERLNLLRQYFDETNALLDTGLFAVLGHVGIFRRTLPEEGFSPVERAFVEFAETALAERLAGLPILVEVNTSGCREDARMTTPRPRFLETYFRAGGRSVCLGSDAHEATALGRAFPAVWELLRGIGFEALTSPGRSASAP